MTERYGVVRGRKVVHSSAKYTPGKDTPGNDNWRTPAWLLDLVREVFDGPIQLDPCADSDFAQHFAWRNITKEDNALLHATTWFEPQMTTCFMNPPYSQAMAFNQRLIAELQFSNEAIVLMAARTDTAKWRVLAEATSVLCLVDGRIQFDDPRSHIEHCDVLWPTSVERCGACNSLLTTVAGFPSALFYFGPHAQRFNDIMGQIGGIWLPKS